jgi:hypothetical protein
MHVVNSENKTLYYLDTIPVIPQETPFGGVPVSFSGQHITEVLKRGVDRLQEAHRIQQSHFWTEFGWQDGGLTSVAVNDPVGALRIVANEAWYCRYRHGVRYPNDMPDIRIPFTGDNWNAITRVLFNVLVTCGRSRAPETLRHYFD